MARPKFGTVGAENEILNIIRSMHGDGKPPTEIVKALADAGYRTRNGLPFSRQGVSSIIIDSDRARRVVLDLRQRSGRLSESWAEFRMLASTDASCAQISARVETLQEGGLPQVEAIAEAVAVA